MKNSLIIFVSFFSIVFVSCREDFDIAREWKDIPVVYGILSTSDTAHYIRVERAFLDPNINAFELAKEPDSLYYKNLLVQIEDLNNGRVYTLTEIDGALDGYPRSGGIFAETPNILYKITAEDMPLEALGRYRLIIDRGDEKPLITGTTTMIRDFRIFSPVIGATLRIQYNSTIRLTWETHPEIAFYDAFVLFNYREFPKGDPGNFVTKQFRWQIGSRLSGSPQNFIGEQFYRTIGDQIPVDPNVERTFRGIDVMIAGGGEEFFEYIKVIIANLGLTGTQDVPNYSNLSEGLGLFTTRTRTINSGILLHPESLDSLRFGVHTKDLNFK
jgi:hypothetical protein